MHRDQRGDRGIQQALRRLAARRIEHRIGVHVVTDVAHQHQAAARQRKRAAIRRGVFAIGGQAARDRAAVLVEGLGQCAAHQAEPVAIGRHLVLGIDAGDRVLAVLDRGDRGLQHHVGNTGRILSADRTRAIDDDLDVQAVVLQQHRRRIIGGAAIADELLGPRQSGPRMILQRDHEPTVVDRVARRIAMAADGERHRLVENLPRLGNHAGAADGVVAGDRASRRHPRGSRRCRTARRTGCPSAHSPHSAHSAHWSPARRAAGRRCWRSRDRRCRCRSRSPAAPAADSRCRAGIRCRWQHRSACRVVPDATHRSGAAAHRACRAAPCCVAPDRGPARQTRRQNAAALDAGPGNRLVVDEVVQRARNLHAAGGHEVHSMQLLAGSTQKRGAASLALSAFLSLPPRKSQRRRRSLRHCSNAALVASFGG